MVFGKSLLVDNMYSLSKFYKSKEWENLLQQLKLERVNSNGELVCEYCGFPIIKKYDCIGHHEIELTDTNVNDLEISLNPDNIKLIHHACHNRIHERFGHDKVKKVYIVYGPPCSGKSSYVNEIATKDDLILDIDKIWECISSSDKYHKSNRIKVNVFGVRDTLLDQIKCRVGMWKTAYVIGGYPLASDRERLSKLLGAELIFIDEDKDTCLSRCKNEEWKEFVNDWFDLYTV